MCFFKYFILLPALATLKMIPHNRNLFSGNQMLKLFVLWLAVIFPIPLTEEPLGVYTQILSRLLYFFPSYSLRTIVYSLQDLFKFQRTQCTPVLLEFPNSKYVFNDNCHQPTPCHNKGNYVDITIINNSQLLCENTSSLFPFRQFIIFQSALSPPPLR